MLFTTVVGLFTNKQSLTSFMRRISIRKIGNILINFGTNVCLMQKEKKIMDLGTYTDLYICDVVRCTLIREKLRSIVPNDFYSVRKCILKKNVLCETVMKILPLDGE